MIEYFVCSNRATNMVWIETVDLEAGDSLPSTRAYVNVESVHESYWSAVKVKEQLRKEFEQAVRLLREET